MSARENSLLRPATRGVRVGGRSKRVVDAVLSAALQELAHSGYAAFRIEEIARASGVNRTSIYRRWPTKVSLIEAALREVSPFNRAQPDTGDLARDLLDLSLQLVRWMRSAQGKSLMQLLMREVRQPELIQVAKTLGDEALAPYRARVEAAQVRGEIARDIDPDLFLQMILAPVTVRIERGERVDRRVLTTLIDITVRGASPHAIAPRSRKVRALGR